MVYTVTLNPAIDYIVSPAKFAAGEINRYQKAVYGPGGKGANVSLLLSSLGVRNRALGICAGFSGGEIVRLLEERGCETDFVRMPQGHSRINVKVCAPDGEETDLNGDGPDTPPEAVEELLQKLDGLGEGDTLVLAGSIPGSVPGDIYAAMLRRLEGRGVLAVVDATGEALRCV
ncbi:1-phosphofructokinase family hexose kinase, partial [Neglectibacter timonensis]